MGEVIAVTSGKAGVGRTTFTANLGAALSDLGKRVLLVDADIGNGDLDMALGLESQVVYNIVDIVEGNCKILQALVKDKEEQSLYFLPASRTRDISAVSEAQFLKLLKIFKREFDFVLVDAPAGTGRGFRSAVSSADRIFVLTTPDRFAIRSSVALTKALSEEQKDVSYLIINRLRMDLLKEKEITGPEKIVECVSLPLFGVTVESDDVLLQTENGRPVVDINSSACHSYVNVARRILGENVPIVLKARR